MRGLATKDGGGDMLNVDSVRVPGILAQFLPGPVSFPSGYEMSLRPFIETLFKYQGERTHFEGWATPVSDPKFMVVSRDSHLTFCPSEFAQNYFFF